MSTHTTSVHADWAGGFNGRGQVRAPGFSQLVSLPREFQGLGEGASPEDLLLSALASCYLITLGIMLEKAQLSSTSLTVTAELATDLQPIPKIREAILRVRIVSNEDPDRLEALSKQAESFCLIARAVAGNITKRVELRVERVAEGLF